MTADAQRRTALAPFADPLRELGAQEVVLGSQVSLRVDGEGARALGLPTDPNTWARLDGREALWLGPDEWLVTSEVEAAGDVMREIGARSAGRHRSIVDVSANRVALELLGRDRLDTLAAGCGLDLHPRSWRAGMCAQTLLASIAVLLHERDDVTRIHVRPSFAGHLVRWLAAVRSLG